MSRPTPNYLQAAIEAGLLPPSAQVDASQQRPWPVVLLTALGAWFAAVPLLFAMGMLLADTMRDPVGPYAVGALVLCAAVMVIRASDLPLFVEQLAVPALLVGGGALGMGLYRDVNDQLASAILSGVALGLATVLPKTWLRLCLGALAAALLSWALMPHSPWRNESADALLALHSLLALWLMTLWIQARATQQAALLEALSVGWLLTTLVGLSWTAGSTFLVGAAVGNHGVGEAAAWLLGFAPHSWPAYAIQFGSSALAIGGAIFGARAWPSLRQTLPVCVALVLALLAWFMPMLGAVLLALGVTATTHRWRLAAACAAAACWILGAFYYQLQWSLVEKALLFVGAGIGLGALTWLHHRKTTPEPEPTVKASDQPTDSPRAIDLGKSGLAILGTALLTLLVANGAIWQKQDLLAHGKPVFMALAPVDPRSLMQGDFMRLDFAALDDHSVPLLEDLGGKRPHVVLKLDARGVAEVLRVHTADLPLAPNEMLLQLTPKDGRWVVVTDAWFFKEGDAKHWDAAKFGEFRVMPDGRALLVGLANASLEPIKPDDSPP